jgi:murein DD-endopeptidase MepM/ murein hydrolase activator NlpD
MLIKYPVKNTHISQPFGKDTSGDPVYSKFYELFDYKHCGVDFPVSAGTEVFASFAGIVVRCENHSGMGNVVGVRNGNIVALYAHLSKISVQLGGDVEEGALIGNSGCSGNACPTPHLHFELRDISKPTLKEMVFDPPFNKDCGNYSDTFTYVVNTKNTKKTLKSLAQLYFGTETKWELLRDVNGYKFDGEYLLEDGLVVTIPSALVPCPYTSENAVDLPPVYPHH